MHPLFGPSATLDDLRRAARSPDPEDRGRGMQALLNRVRREPALQATALPVFRDVLASDEYAWPGVLAARGVEHIEGPVAARAVWLELLERKSPQLVRNAALSLTDVFYVPALIELLQRRDEPDVRSSVIRALGRIRHRNVLPAIIGFVDDPLLRADVVEALGDQGDARAKPYLQPLLTDDSDSGTRDERGAVLTIAHLAWTALRRFDDPAFDRACTPATFRPFDHE